MNEEIKKRDSSAQKGAKEMELKWKQKEKEWKRDFTPLGELFSKISDDLIE